MNDNIVRDVIRSLQGKRTKGTPIDTSVEYRRPPPLPYWQSWRPPKDPSRTRYPWEDDRTKWEKVKDFGAGVLYLIFGGFLE